MADILLLEDGDALRRIMTRALVDEGHSVTESATGEIVLVEGTLDTVDVMITDLMMPWMNGLEAIIAARKINPDLKIIAISGGCDILSSDYLPHCLKLGASEVLHKPFEPDALVETVNAVLRAACPPYSDLGNAISTHTSL